MIHILSRMKQTFPHLNREPVTEKDFWRVAKRENIFVHFWNVAENVKGFYGVNRRYKVPRHYIVINTKLLPEKWLLTGLHELIHHFLHVPQTSIEVYFSSRHISNRQDKEAEALALIALIPRPMFFKISRTPFEEIEPEMIEILLRRKEVFEQFGV